MNQVNHEVLKNISDLMTKSHTGKQGGSYGCMPKAARIAVEHFGDGWIEPKRGCRLNKTLHDWFQSSVRITCPPNSNIDRAKQKFFEYAAEHAVTLKTNSTNKVRAKLSRKDLLKQLE